MAVVNLQPAITLSENERSPGDRSWPPRRKGGRPLEEQVPRLPDLPQDEDRQSREVREMEVAGIRTGVFVDGSGVDPQVPVRGVQRSSHRRQVVHDVSGVGLTPRGCFIWVLIHHEETFQPNSWFVLYKGFKVAAILG